MQKIINQFMFNDCASSSGNDSKLQLLLPKLQITKSTTSSSCASTRNCICQVIIIIYIYIYI